jgi:hypothetical protein
LVAIRWPTLQGLEGNGLQRLWHGGDDFNREPRCSAAYQIRNREIVTGVRHQAAEQLVENHAQRVHVSPRVDRPRRIQLFRGDVRQCADEVPARRIARAETEIENARRSRTSMMFKA